MFIPNLKVNNIVKDLFFNTYFLLHRGIEIIYFRDDIWLLDNCIVNYFLVFVQ